MTKASNPLDEALLSLAWSLWAELGVSSVVSEHEHCFVDPEPLLVFTAALASADPRLRDESLDCALALAPYLWIARLKTVLAKASDAERVAFASYAAAFNQASRSHVKLPLADGAKPFGFRRSGKSKPEKRADAPSQLGIRCRAIFGVTARADTLAVVLCSRSQGWVASELAQHVGMPKRAVATVLEDFARGGIMRATPVANRLRYDLVARKGLDLIVGARPKWKPAWNVLLPFLFRARAILAQATEPTSVSLLVDSQKLIRGFLAEMAMYGFHTPEPEYRSWPAVSTWLLSLADSVARAESRWLATEARTAA